MICKPCQIGGDLVAEARTWDMKNPQETVFNEVAASLHFKCRGATHCDCQHKVDWEGKSIQS